jgi:hypothetical protein
MACVQDMSPRDYSLAENLSATLAHSDPGWVRELQTMMASGSKAELEAVYTACGGAEGFSGLVMQAIKSGEAV